MSPMLPILRETLAKLESFPRDHEDTNQFVERWMRTLQGRAAMMLEAVEMIETCHPEYARRIIPEGTKEECIELVERSREALLAYSETLEAILALNASIAKTITDFHVLAEELEGE